MLHQTAHMSRLTQIAPSDCRIHVAFKVLKVDSAYAPGLRARRTATSFRRDSHHARLLRTGGDDNDTLVPPRRRAGACAHPPIRTLRA